MTKKEILKMQAAMLFVASRFEDGIDFLKLFKILYFANKYHLKEALRPIVSDSFLAMKNGPVPHTLYFIFKGWTKDEYNVSSSEEICDNMVFEIGRAHV